MLTKNLHRPAVQCLVVPVCKKVSDEECLARTQKHILQLEVSVDDHGPGLVQVPTQHIQGRVTAAACCRQLCKMLCSALGYDGEKLCPLTLALITSFYLPGNTFLEDSRAAG